MGKLLIVTAATLLIALSAGCGQQQAPPTAASTPQPQATIAAGVASPTEVPKPAATATRATSAAPSPTVPQPAQTVEDLLSKADWRADFSCELITTTPDSKVTAFLALKGKRMRMDMEAEGRKVVWVADSDAKTAVMYSPEEKTGMKFPIDQFQTQTAEVESPDDVVTKHPEGKIVGEETIDGRLCTVYEYKDADTTGRVWIWKDKGFPLKVVATTQAGTSTVEYKNITLGGVDDKIFEIPADITLVDFGSLPRIPTPES